MPYHNNLLYNWNSFHFCKYIPPPIFVLRSVVHDVAEIAGLATFSFGEEDEDRHIQVDECGLDGEESTDREDEGD